MKSVKLVLRTVLHCFIIKGTNRDLRRMLILQIIQDEFIDRDTSNCTGFEYRAWRDSFRIINPEKFDLVDGDLSMIHRDAVQKHSEFRRLNGHPCLIRRSAVEFFSRNNLLGSIELPINHPSEKLGILTLSQCTLLIQFYVENMGLKYPTYAYIDNQLIEVLGSKFLTTFQQAEIGQNYPMVFTEYNRLCISLAAVPHIVEQSKIDIAPIRNITTEIVNSMGQINEYVRRESANRIEAKLRAKEATRGPAKYNSDVWE